MTIYFEAIMREEREKSRQRMNEIRAASLPQDAFDVYLRRHRALDDE